MLGQCPGKIEWRQTVKTSFVYGRLIFFKTQIKDGPRNRGNLFESGYALKWAMGWIPFW